MLRGILAVKYRYPDVEDVHRSLTGALVHRDFGLKLRLPPGRLCPPVRLESLFCVFHRLKELA